MASTLIPAPPAPPPVQPSRPRRALARVFDAVALAGTTLAREAPARPQPRRRGRFTR